MNGPLVRALLESGSAHGLSLVLIALRLAPLAFFCPVLGGPQAPVWVRFGVVATFCISLHWGGGISAGEVDAWTALSWGLRELLFGTALGMASAVPFDIARVSGRWMDMWRGTSAEASLPWVGTQESSTGDFLHQLLVALCAGGLGWDALVHGIWRSFATVKLGLVLDTESLVAQVCGLLASLLGVALAVGAPIAVASLAVDFLLGIVNRAFPRVVLRELGSPVKILGGAALCWACAGVMGRRLVDVLAGVETAISVLSEAAR